MLSGKVFKATFISLIFLFQYIPAQASPDCKNMVFVKPLPQSESEVAIADWNIFIKSINDDHQATVTDTINNQKILSYIKSNKEKSSFNRSLLAFAQYHGCFGVKKDRAIAIDLLKLSADEIEPLSIIYLSLQPEYFNDKKVLGGWSKKLKAAQDSPLVESARYNLKIIAIQENLRKKTPKGFILPFEYEKIYKKQKRSIEKLCDTASSAFKEWRQNGIALRAVSICNMHPYGNNNKYEAYKFLVASLAVGYAPPEAELDRLAISLGNTDTINVLYEQGFHYSGVSLTPSDYEYLNKHLARVISISNQKKIRSQQGSSRGSSDSGRAPRSKTGFFKYETEDGLSKICYYDVLGKTKALNKSATSMCPISYKF